MHWRACIGYWLTKKKILGRSILSNEDNRELCVFSNLASIYGFIVTTQHLRQSSAVSVNNEHTPYMTQVHY